MAGTRFLPIPRKRAGGADGRRCRAPLRTVIVAVLAWLGASAGAAAAGDPAAGEKKAAKCIGCHGVGGRSTDEAIPMLAGQLADYIERAVFEFQEGIRSDERMSGMSALLADPQDLADIAAYFASQPRMQGKPTQGERVERGRALFVSGRCSFCHGDGGMRHAPFLPVVPVIGGQHKAYLAKAIKDIRDAKRPGDFYDMMRQTVAEMSDADIEAIAEYLSGL